MWRTGVYSREHFLALHRSGAVEAHVPRISLQLLDIETTAPNTEDIEIFEGVSRWFRTSSGVYRTTYARRLSLVDELATRLMQKLFPRETALVIEDRAASHALTSAEWAESLVRSYPKLRFIASDPLLFLIEAKFRNKQAFLLEPDGTPLQCIQPPFVLPLDEPESKLHAVNQWMISEARRRLRKLRIPEAWAESSGTQTLHLGDWQIRKISLVHPSARALEQSGQFTIAQGSIFDVSPEPCTVLRAMNILTPLNFSPEEIRRGILAAHASLVEGGLWIVGRTHEKPVETHHATLLRKQAEGFHILERSGEGAEIEALIRSAFT